MAERNCSDEACGELARFRGMCPRHYNAWLAFMRKSGTPLPPSPTSIRIPYGAPGYPKRPLLATHRSRLFTAIGPGSHPCHWCRRMVSWDIDFPHKDALVVDHLDADRGNNHLVNLVASCQTCNSRRAVLAKSMHRALERIGFPKMMAGREVGR